MKYACSISFRPFGSFTKAFFIKRYIFDTKLAMYDFITEELPWYKKKYPFTIGYYCIHEEDNL